MTGCGNERGVDVAETKLHWKKNTSKQQNPTRKWKKRKLPRRSWNNLPKLYFVTNQKINKNEIVRSPEREREKLYKNRGSRKQISITIFDRKKRTKFWAEIEPNKKCKLTRIDRSSLDLSQDLPAVVRLSSYSTWSLIVLLCTDFKKRSVVCGNDWNDKLMYRSRSVNASMSKRDACSRSSRGTPLVSSPDIDTRWKCGTISWSSNVMSSLVCAESPTANVDCRSSRALRVKGNEKN